MYSNKMSKLKENHVKHLKKFLQSEVFLFNKELHLMLQQAAKRAKREVFR